MLRSEAYHHNGFLLGCKGLTSWKSDSKWKARFLKWFYFCFQRPFIIYVLEWRKIIHKNTIEWSQKQKQANLPDWETSVERYGINNNLEYQSNEIKLTIYIYTNKSKHCTVVMQREAVQHRPKFFTSWLNRAPFELKKDLYKMRESNFWKSTFRSWFNKANVLSSFT